MLLDRSTRARIERLSFTARRRVRARWAGRHPSFRKGESLDFADYREYVPGDDYRRIDHALWARLGTPLIREFEAEEELPLDVVVDLSQSMTFDRKAHTARVVAALLTYLALSGGDRVRLHALPGSGGRAWESGPGGRHLSAWPRLETWLESRPEGGVALLQPPIRALSAGPVHGSVVLVTDLLTEDWEGALDGLVGMAGGIVLHVLAPSELVPDLAGDLELVDAETGLVLAVSMSEQAMEAYRARVERFAADAAARARRAGCDYLLVPAVPTAADDTLAALAAAEVVA